MTKFIFFCLLFFLQNTFAGRGLVIGYRTPMYEKPDVNSKKVLVLKQGSRVYIHDRHIRHDEDQNKPGFYQSLDKNANVTFIEKKYIKLLTNTQKEEKKSVSLEPDPTDHRIDSPLPKDYPFVKSREYRGSISFGYSPGEKNSYQYAKNISTVKNTERAGLSYILGRNALDDFDKRLFFGALSELWYSKNSIRFEDASEAQETMLEFHIGPQISYDFFRDKDMSLSLLAALTLNYNHASISVTGNENQPLESRSYSGFGFSPKLQSVYTFHKLVDEFSLRLGLEAQWSVAHSLQTSQTNNEYGYWNGGSDQLDVSNNGIWSVFIGFQKTY